jgi:four helix bundle protein
MKSTNYNNFENLDAWKEAHILVLSIYQATKEFPKEEQYGLQSQLRRAAVSVASNLVEGNERRSKKEFMQFCFMAKASLAETRYQLKLSKDLNYITNHAYDKLLDQSIKTNKLISGLISYLKS